MSPRLQEDHKLMLMLSFGGYPLDTTAEHTFKNTFLHRTILSPNTHIERALGGDLLCQYEQQEQLQQVKLVSMLIWAPDYCLKKKCEPNL